MKICSKITKSHRVLLPIPLLIMLVALPVHAADETNDITIFENTLAAYDDNDSLGLYGDENDEEVLDDETSNMDSLMLAASQYHENALDDSAVVYNVQNDCGYGDNWPDEEEV